ncbi:PHP domain-containing protein [Haloterrigena salina JCM 13891]|uniref:PHP domain-containing protein n=1 Tax=Haloterrigena salina JCM 13891 TaxID=1227488 RepID=M0C984_9EURY|nr:PHP domain-containing protein [Haloterrigena salina]ELZ19795.1 PHP domain-containing protein [Haloterrigena salina JCM 13891]
MTSRAEYAAVDRGPQTLRIDPHVHTTASYDGTTTPAELVDAARRAGLDGIAVTDHDTIDGAREVARLASDDLLVIIGCEVSTADGHLLALGVDAAPEPGRPLPQTARAVREAGGVAIVAHPFQRSRHGARRAAIENVDGVEVYNAHAVTNVRNRQADQFATRRDYPRFGASDAHRPENVGRAATDVRLPADAVPSTADTPPTETVLEAMRAGRTDPVGDRTTTWQYLTKVVGNARRKTTSLSLF